MFGSISKCFFLVILLHLKSLRGGGASVCVRACVWRQGRKEEHKVIKEGREEEEGVWK